MQKLNGKVAVITGGNSGIGLAAAEAFVREGAKVAIFGRNPETLAAAVARLNGSALRVQGDVSKLEDLDQLFTEVREQLGGIDVLFVNAGIAVPAPFDQTTEAMFDQTFDVNVKGAFFTVQKALPLLNDGASVILTTSIANVKGMPEMSVYSASKAALRSFARTLSASLVHRGIRVNAVSPGPIETPIFGRLGMEQAQLDEFAQQMVSQIPLQRFGEAGEVAEAVVFLASPESSFVLGTELVVDGGMSQI